MDIVERLAQQAAETINGGEFNDGTWYTEGQRQAWRKAMTPAADEIERLRGIINDDRLEGAADEIERLRKALQQIANIDYRGPMPDGVAIARKALWEKD